METLTKKNEKSEEQRKKENAEYIANLKKNAPQRKRSLMHLVGSISKETAEKMLKHVENDRNSNVMIDFIGKKLPAPAALEIDKSCKLLHLIQ